MAKKKKRKHQTHKNPPVVLDAFAWQQQDGFHYLMPGLPPTPEMLEEMTKQYQENIRNSPLWDIMVKQFGKEKAEALLEECRAELR